VTMIADYELLRPLGQGVTGQFYLAHPPSRLGLQVGEVAVKVVRGPIGEDPFKRVVNELRIFASTNSEYLVTLYDAGQEEGSLYYAMQYYPAGSLAAPAAPLDAPGVCAALADAARGAHALHEGGVAHRNIKPGNVLLADGGRGRLSDLGLAKFMSPGQTVTRSGSVGEVEYLEPASVRGERATRATDVWALGATLHRVLTGRPIYPGLTGTDVLADLRRVLNERPTVDPSLPPGVAALVTDCLAADPAERPSTALEVATRLDEIGVRPW
jgi:eukaryotic-like serine/threonine-protein kinase